MSKSSEFVSFFDDDRRKSVLRGAIGGFYEAARSKPVIFDTNRLWTGRLSLLFSLFPNARVVCCVRDIGWIIDSVEGVLRQNPLLLSKMFAFQAGSSVYQRAAHLMNAEKGLIGRPWHTLREACFGPHAERLIVVSYDYLVKHPDKVMAGLYDFLDIPMFSHDFENISFDTPDYDDELGMPGLHRVRRKVEARARLPNIPPELFEKHKNASFWQSEPVKARVKVFAFS